MQSLPRKPKKEELPAKTEKVVLPEGTIEFELDEEEHLFDGEVSPSEGNFTQAEKAGNLSGPSSHSSGSFFRAGNQLERGETICPAGIKKD